MKLTVLGYYGGYPAKGIGTSSFLLTANSGYQLLIDCGSGALMALERVLDPLKLNAVILSHYHADHIADVGVLQHYWQLVNGNKAQPLLPIYGHSLDEIQFNQLDWPNATEKHSYQTDKALKLGPFTISFFKTKHPVDTFAMRIKEEDNDKEVVYTADTTVCEGLAEFIAGASILLADTNFYADKTGQRWHLTAPEAGELAKTARVQSLWLTHLPQTGLLTTLVTQAQFAAGRKVNVQRVHQGQIIKI